MRRFGLIGYPLSHSFSQKYFTDKFQQDQISGALYQNFPLQAITELPAMLSDHPDLAGFNITIPYKEQVMPYLHRQSPVVQEIGACNCVKIVNGQLTGYNTDVVGFEVSLQQYLQPHHKKALVLGTGGAAKAVYYVLQKMGIDFIKVSRHAAGSGQLSYEQVDAAVIKAHTLIVNTTPLGMYPKVDEYPLLPYDAITPAHYLFDLIYNPATTAFLQKGAGKGAVIHNGADMLVIQAEESWRIWNQA